MSTYAVTAENLKKYFKDIKAVDNVSLSISKGEIYGLIGPDGAGKTTLLRMLAGILKPDSGESLIAGLSSQKEHDLVKDHIAYMAQKFGLYQDLTVYENVKFYAELYGVEKHNLDNHIYDLLDFSYMRPFKDRRAGRLSGGMKQKLQLVCALVHKPDVLLLDEPTNGVDPVSRRDFWRILYKLSADGVTIVVSTAYLDEAERCTRVGLMNGGRIIAEGKPDEVVKKSGLGIVSIKCGNCRLASTILKEKFGSGNVHVFGDKVKVSFDNPEEGLEAVKDYLSRKGFSGFDAFVDEPTLEDIFLGVLQGSSETGDDILSMVASKRENPDDYSVKTKKLTKQFEDFTAVNSVDLSISYGEVFGFLGPNGAGKSTTIKMLCGLLPPSSGMGMVGGNNIVTNAEDIKKNIGYMSQKFSLYEDLKVFENINFYGRIYGLSGKKLSKRREWALELSGLSGRSKDMTANLTGGWRQRLALACSILHEPPIVFLDEPTSGADPASRRLFWNIIYELADSGVTVFVSTHYMEEAEYCDRLALIFRGNMIALGTPEQLKTEMMEDSIIEVTINQPQDYLDGLLRLESINDAALFGSGIHARTVFPDRAEEEIKNFFSQQNIIPRKIIKIKPSMEDVFVSLIEQADRENQND